MGVAEVDHELGGVGDDCVVGHFVALIPGQRSTQGLWQLAHRLDHGCLDVVGAVTVGQVQQHEVAGGTFNEGADGGLVLFAGDQVAFRKTVGGSEGSGVA